MKITTGGRYSGFASSVNAGDVTFDNSGGGTAEDNVQDVLDDVLSGGLSGYLTVIRGGQGTIQSLGTLGATPTVDLGNANYFYGTLDQDCTVSTTGWTAGKDSQITLEITEDGTGGWTPTFTGVTFIGGTPTWDTTLGTVTHVVLFSRDGGVTIYGAVIGAGSTALRWIPLTVYEPSIANYLPLVDGSGNQIMAEV